jgi:hypothetical protein
MDSVTVAISGSASSKVSSGRCFKEGVQRRTERSGS